MTKEGSAPFSNQVPTTIALAGQPANIQIHIGFEMEYDCPVPTPMLLDLSIHHSRAPDLVRPDLLLTSPVVPVSAHMPHSRHSLPRHHERQLANLIGFFECLVTSNSVGSYGHVAEFCQCPLSCLRERVMSWFGSQRMTVVKGAPHLPFCDFNSAS
jgi:hypothetical protein